MQFFAPITKVNEATREVEGILALEQPDRSGEIFDYASSKEHFRSWSEDIQKATDGKSVGNLRAMHGNVAAGKFTAIEFDDENKRIPVVAKVVDDNEWKKVLEGVYTGFSIGGSYIRKWNDEEHPELKRYTAKPAEGSLVDLPCIPGAQFTMVRKDGESEMRKFVSVKKVSQVWQCESGCTHEKKDEALKCDGVVVSAAATEEVIEKTAPVEDPAPEPEIEKSAEGDPMKEEEKESPAGSAANAGEETKSEATKVDETGELAKQADALAKAVERVDEVAKAVGEQKDAIATLTGLVKDLTERVASMPAPSKVRKFTKAEDGTVGLSGGDESTQKSEDPIDLIKSAPRIPLVRH